MQPNRRGGVVVTLWCCRDRSRWTSTGARTTEQVQLILGVRPSGAGRRAGERVVLVGRSKRNTWPASVSRRNRRGGILVHPRHKNPDRPFHLRGKSLAVRFLDRAIRAVGSASGYCSRGPRRPFLETPLRLISPALNLAIPNEPWACIERDPLVGEGGYVSWV
jgi:hypothetical protein